MIKNMDLKFSVLKSQSGVLRFMDFSGGKMLIGCEPFRNADKENIKILPFDLGKDKNISVLITGLPEKWIDPLFAVIRQNPEIKAYMAEDAYSLIKHFWEKKAELAISEGRKNEAAEINAMCGNLCHIPYGDKISVGNNAIEFIKIGAKLGNAAAKIISGENSAIIGGINYCSELLKPVCRDSSSAQADIAVLNLPPYFVSPDKTAGQQEIIDYARLAEEINSAKKNLGLFFIPADVFDIPLVVKALNLMQEKGLIQQDIRICPVGLESKDILRIYEENGIKLNYASAYLENSIQPSSLFRAANCGFRIFITPGKDVSDLRNSFSANLFSFAKVSPSAAVVFPERDIPEIIAGMRDIPEDKKCRVFACDMIGTPELKHISGMDSAGQFSYVLLAENNKDLCEETAAMFKNIQAKSLLGHNSNLSFYKDGKNGILAVNGNVSKALVLLVSEEMEEKGFADASVLLKRIISEEKNIPGNNFSGKYEKIFLISRKETLPLAEEIYRSCLEKASVPASLDIIPDNAAACKNRLSLFVVSYLCKIMEEFADFSIFLGEYIVSASWAAMFSYFFGKKAWYLHKNKISSLFPIPLPFEDRKLDAYWGNIREIAENGNADLINSVPGDLLNLALSKEDGVFSYTAYGILLDAYCRAKGKRCPVSSSALPKTEIYSGKKSMPSAAVFTVGDSLFDHYLRLRCEEYDSDTEVSSVALMDFIKEDAENGYQNCCDELRTLFSLPDPALLKNCRKIVFLAADNARGKIVSEALENFFKQMNLETETVFVEPFEDDSVYGLNDTGLFNVADALKNLKLANKELLFLLCGGEAILNWYVNVAAMLFKDTAYACAVSDELLGLMPALPLDPDISSYSSMREFMQIIADLRLEQRYDALPDLFKDLVIRKTGQGIIFTALQPLMETLHFIKNPEASYGKNKKNNGTLMAYGENGHPKHPFFIVKKKNKAE